VVNDHSSQPQFAQLGISELHYYDLATGKTSQVELGWPRGLATQTENDNVPGLVVLRDGFLALLANGVRHVAARYVREGAGCRRPDLAVEQGSTFSGLHAAPDGQSLASAYSTASTPTQWYRARLEGTKVVGAARVTDLNEPFEKRRRARTEVVRWKGGLGDE